VNFFTNDWLTEAADGEEPTALADGDMWPDGDGGLELVRPVERFGGVTVDRCS
jgi:hypothetical protein